MNLFSVFYFPWHTIYNPNFNSRLCASSPTFPPPPPPMSRSIVGQRVPTEKPREFIVKVFWTVAGSGRAFDCLCLRNVVAVQSVSCRARGGACRNCPGRGSSGGAVHLERVAVRLAFGGSQRSGPSQWTSNNNRPRVSELLCKFKAPPPPPPLAVCAQP